MTARTYNTADAGFSRAGCMLGEGSRCRESVLFIGGNQSSLSGKRGQYKQLTCDSQIQISHPSEPGTRGDSLPFSLSGASFWSRKPPPPCRVLAPPVLFFWLPCSHRRSQELTVNLGLRLHLSMYPGRGGCGDVINYMSQPATVCYK